MAVRSTAARRSYSFGMLAPVALPTGTASGNLNDSRSSANGTAVAVKGGHGLSHRQFDTDSRIRRRPRGLDTAGDDAETAHRETAPALPRDRRRPPRSGAGDPHASHSTRWFVPRRR